MAHPERYHQKSLSQPHGLLLRKLKIQRAEGNFGNEEQGLRRVGKGVVCGRELKMEIDAEFGRRGSGEEQGGKVGGGVLHSTSLSRI